MKKYIFAILIASSFFFTACEKDNFDEPKSELKGRVASKGGASIGVKGTDGSVQMQLRQKGYEKFDPISVYVNQNGEFSAALFDGDYQLITRDNNGPWVNDRDTMFISVKGSTSVTYEVNPYFILKNEDFKVDNNTLTATFDVEKVTSVAGRDIERITLYVNNTAFADASFRINDLSKDVTTPVEGRNTVSVDLSAQGSNTFHSILYARIGVKIQGVDQLLYTTGSVKIKG